MLAHTEEEIPFELEIDEPEFEIADTEGMTPCEFEIVECSEIDWVPKKEPFRTYGNGQIEYASQVDIPHVGILFTTPDINEIQPGHSVELPGTQDRNESMEFINGSEATGT